MAGRGAYQRKAQNIVNVRARHDLLIAGIKAPTSIDKTVHASLVGQRAFAALDLPKLKITPIALNTLKSLANQIFIEPNGIGATGFAYFDSLRVKLGLSLSKSTAKRTVEAKAERVEDKTCILMERLTATEAQSIKRQKAYLSLYSAVNGLIKNGGLQPEAQERLYRVLENHQAAFENLFEPNIGSAITNEGAVTKLPEKKQPK
ncbi:MAG: hypothetical protein KJ614_17845 [Gammaproteobacteria bacterium]|uniref:hypothetical protein n=1 Tax=Rhodoferax sp. TaxID=50421 RepID=UPI0017B8DD06|nr:hypothetical protein [Rhodoferax sp.]MBA3056704.1 hypothetical protein [Rhodoferax sp.]MBU3900751.1 hypothetical protein [Gammaproteobacteria bacterium]MBU4079502.1 hypothetical protein [Gammaproteobacteria bacterium]MBU4170539.1 hypothetical protein [Gammaproteobacteria bacterium]